MQDRIILQSGETWSKMSSDKVKPAGNPDRKKMRKANGGKKD